MTGFPAANPSQAGQGLFTPEEVRRLMWAECFRARRYEHPLSLMVIGVDRLEHLGDLYGRESRAAIHGETWGTLRSSIRESDLLGSEPDGRFVALFPHTSSREAPGIARRLLQRAGRMLFDEGASTLHVTLSIGLTSRTPDLEFGLDELLEEARQAYAEAVGAGGDRFRVHVPPPPPEPIVIEAPVIPVDTAILAEDLAGNLSGLVEKLESVLSRRVRELFTEMGEKVPDFHGHEREVLQLAVRKLETDRERQRQEHEQQVDLLQRRLAKLSDSLEMTEDELRRIMKMKAVDPGVASIYRAVQGLDAAQDDFQLKREMMAKIFEANVELQKDLGGG